MEKYRIKEKHANDLAAFLKPMLTWYTNKRATAQDMLSHPWLNTDGDDFDGNYHYTDREYEVLMLKKQMKGGNKGDEEAKQEMSELQISEPEENAADDDSDYDEDSGDADSEGSFLDEIQQRRQKELLMKNAVKINNSFTGPYP
jgi:hypothetical protein